ncbi:unnamed protein product [Alopecurus aequalis]
MEKEMLPGKLRHRRQGGDGHGAEAIAVRRSSTSESSTRCVIGGNVEVSHRRVAAPVASVRSSSSMSESSTRCVIGGNMESGHGPVVAPVENVWQRVCHGGTLMVKE